MIRRWRWVQEYDQRLRITTDSVETMRHRQTVTNQFSVSRNDAIKQVRTCEAIATEQRGPGDCCEVNLGDS